MRSWQPPLAQGPAAQRQCLLQSLFITLPTHLPIQSLAHSPLPWTQRSRCNSSALTKFPLALVPPTHPSQLLPTLPSPPCPSLAEGQAAERVQRQCLQLRSEMSHFVTNLQYYLMFEVMESAWQVGEGGCAGDVEV